MIKRSSFHRKMLFGYLIAGLLLIGSVTIFYSAGNGHSPASSATTLPSNSSATSAKPTEPPKSGVKNIILMISDGCGYNEILATDYYQYGKVKTQVYESFPVQAGVSTYSTGSYDTSLAWSDFDYVKNGATDSAAASTAMSTGFKTYNEAIGVDMNGKRLKNVVEACEARNKSTGVVTSVEFSHATPAGFVAHNVSRDNYAALANEMLISSAVDVIMGAGNPFYDDSGISRKNSADYRYVGGQKTWDGLVNGTLAVGDADGDGASDPWTLIQSKEEFRSMAKGVTPDRVIGVPQVFTTLQQARDGDTGAAPFKVALNPNVPDLAEMSAAALNVLDNNKNGFFLMVEGGAIDWASAANQSGRLIEEEIAFNKAVEAVCDWVSANSSWNETLLIVTSDHETGYLTGPGSDPKWKPIINNGAGRQPGMAWNSSSHTNSLVPLFAKGSAASRLKPYADKIDPVRGSYIDNTDIAKAIFSLIG